MSYSNRPLGPLGIDPLYFSLALFGCLFLFVIYLLLPRAVRVQYFDAYPKRYSWSAKPRRLRMPGVEATTGSVVSAAPSSASSTFSLFGRKQSIQPVGGSIAASTIYSKRTVGGMEETVEFHGAGTAQSFASHTSDEAAIQNITTQLRNHGVTIVAHGSRGKPKTVRLQLTNDSITWRTETKRKTSSGSHSKEIKLGKVHSVALSNIMYVDVGKQTTALRRPENASVPESLCFSLLTKEGSLDLEAKSPRDRDALVGSFSLLLDNIHAQNWRDIYRNSNDMPSSFDEYDEEVGVGR